MMFGTAMLPYLNDAIAACDDALRSGRDVIEACRTLGNVLQAMGKFEEAMAWHTRAIQPQVDRAELFASLGKLYAQHQRWSRAIAAYEKSLTANPASAGAYWSLANIYAQQGQQTEEIQHRYLALTLHPAWATPSDYLDLGNRFMGQGRLVEAIACYRYATQDAKFFEAYYNLAVALTHYGLLDEAIPAYRRALELNPRHDEALQGLGKALEYEGNWDGAIAHYLQVLTHVAKTGWAYHNLGTILLKQGRFTHAAKAFRGAIACDPEFPWSYHHWIEALMRQEKWDEAIAACRSTIALGRDYSWSYTLLGRALNFKGELEEAIVCHQKACSLLGWHQCVENGYQFTQDWFSHNTLTWEQHLQPLLHRDDLHALEIGSYQGMSACWLLDRILTHPSARLTCIDPNFQAEFAANIAKTGASHKVTRLVGNSHDLLSHLNPNTYDVIYIDGCHLADHVYLDAVLCWPLLKAGGIAIFDDYEWQDPNYPGQDPKLGIDKFLIEFHDPLEILHKAYQVIIRKAR
jgi:tetratricopeptide (TPR) repeat protein